MTNKVKDLFMQHLAKLIFLGVTSACGLVFTGYQGIVGQLESNEASQDKLTDAINGLIIRVDEVERAMDKLRYESEFNEIKITLEGLVTKEDITGEVQAWIDKNKGSKLASLTTLCEQPDHLLLEKIMSESTATTSCRMIGAI